MGENRNCCAGTPSLNTPASVVRSAREPVTEARTAHAQGFCKAVLYLDPLWLTYFPTSSWVFFFPNLMPFLQSLSIWTDDNVIILIFFKDTVCNKERPK